MDSSRRGNDHSIHSHLSSLDFGTIGILRWNHQKVSLLLCLTVSVNHVWFYYHNFEIKCVSLCTLINIKQIYILIYSFYQLHTQQWFACTSYCGHEDKIVWIILVIISIVTSGTIKYWLWKARKESNLDESATRSNMEFISTSIMQTLVTVVGLIIIFYVQRSEDPMLVRLVLCCNVCITLPLMIFLSKDKMRRVAMQKFRQCLSNHQVYPDLDVWNNFYCP